MQNQMVSLCERWREDDKAVDCKERSKRRRYPAGHMNTEAYS